MAGGSVLYVADDTVGITKYSLVSGSWVSNGTVGAAADAYRGLATVVVGNNVQLYATGLGGSLAAGGGKLVSITDTSGYNGAFAATATTLATGVTPNFELRLTARLNLQRCLCHIFSSP